MRILLDESADGRFRRILLDLGHDVTTVARDHGFQTPDIDVLRIAHAQRRLLIASDRDFGRLVFLEREPHSGVLYFRLRNKSFAAIRERLMFVLTQHGQELDRFITIEDDDIRVR